MKIRAAVLNASPVAAPYAQSRPLRIEELDLAPPGRDEILVRVRAAGLCHSDLSVIDGNRLRPDGAAGAPWPVFDHEGLPERGCQAICDQSDDEFGRAAWRERHDDLDRTIGVALRRGWCSEEEDKVRRQGCGQQDPPGQKELLAVHGAPSRDAFLDLIRDDSAAACVELISARAPAVGHLSPPECGGGRMNSAALIDQSVRAIAGEQKRPVEIDDARSLRHQHGRRHGQ